ncbi:pilus assembly protein PilP [Glaciecola sp. MH2013]|uniref:pilus assembly protein PilP n=1 Tax=Glaciecola sp. MH2013 TaxID=2785524 RepID=UPI00189E4293|nr:pilus assembly protein PilP [Glaciecola sp. MH2013]MBF7073774.1 pilus assembly protein PilP [Glaciecola sp. MH2013]
MKKSLLLLPICLGLGACSAQIDDLIAYTESVKANTNVSIEPYPEFVQLDPVDYEASDLRSPFQRFQQRNDASGPVEVQTANCSQPNRQRQKEKLEAYGIDALQMTGVFSIAGQQYALIQANDGSLHKAKRGQHIGLFFGKITNITEKEVVIEEMIPDGAGCWKTKNATLTMSSITGENNNV